MKKGVGDHDHGIEEVLRALRVDADLEPGGIATFEATYGEAANYVPSCEPRRSSALFVTPPGAHRPQLVKYELERCTRPSQGLNVGRIE